MAPSVTPKKQNVGSNNPGLRLYKFETDTGQVSQIPGRNLTDATSPVGRLERVVISERGRLKVEIVG